MSAPQQELADEASPRRQLSLLDCTSIIVGIIIGSAIYRASPDIAAGAARWAASVFGPSAPAWQAAAVLGVWIVGGLIALVGAMCYAELATAYPRAGGTYVFLSEAFGRPVGFAFAWAEFWIVRPGNVGAIAFVLASYARPLVVAEGPLAPRVELLMAVLSIVVVTLLNAAGLRTGKGTQNLLTAAKVLGLAAIVACALTLPAAAAQSQPLPTEPWKNMALSLILVMFAYGGWADMSFVAAEARDPRRNISRALIFGTLAVAAIYLAVTVSFIRVLGVGGLANSQAVAADVLALCFGDGGRTAISVLVIVSCLGAINGTIFTGARVYYALGIHHPTFRWFGAWNEAKGVPLRSLLVQSAATLCLVVTFGLKPGSFDKLVVFTTPFYWGFIALVGVALILLRRRQSRPVDPAEVTYRVPFYPLLPLVFIASSGLMVYAAVQHALRNPAWEALYAVAVIAAGVVAGLIDWQVGRRR